MGGLTSGRTPYATTPADRECLKLDVNDFTDVLTDDEDTEYSGTASWGDAEITWRTATEAGRETFRVQYTATQDGSEEHYEYPIRVTRTDCNFGGTRPWWECPRCGDRVGTLYLPPSQGKFYCRDCHDIAYSSSRASGNADRTLRMRYNRLRKKLGADPGHPENSGIPDRPKGMHQETYEELVEELEAVSKQWSQEAFFGPLERHTDADGWPFEAADGDK